MFFFGFGLRGSEGTRLIATKLGPSEQEDTDRLRTDFLSKQKDVTESESID
jgi:hypothetical protein